MKKTLFFLCLLALMACEKDKDDSTSESVTDYNNQIKNTPAAGVLDGKPFLYTCARAYIKDTLLSIYLYDSLLSDPCSDFYYLDAVYLRFPARTGAFPITQQVIWKTSATEFKPYIYLLPNNMDYMKECYGYANITLFDTVNNRIQGNFIATFDKNNKVNGTFDVSLCDSVFMTIDFNISE